ncbi:MAG: aldo/keto reductase [Nostocoides sp.]
MTENHLHTRPVRGLPLTELGIGGAQFGNLYVAHTDEEMAETFDVAWAGGMRYIDTAPHYGVGSSEERLGELLASKPREAFVLSTKVGRRLVSQDAAGAFDEPFQVPASRRREWDFSADGIRRSLEESLTRLGLDRVDIVYLHDAEDHWEQARRESLPALVDLRDQGVVRAIGAGMNFGDKLTELITGHDIDVVMCAGRYTLLEQDQALMTAALDYGVAVVVAGAYNSGLLATARPGQESHYDYAPPPAPVLARARELAAICESHSVSLPEAAVQFPLRHPAVAAVAVGMSTPAEVAETIERYTADIPDQLWLDVAQLPPLKRG